MVLTACLGNAILVLRASKKNTNSAHTKEPFFVPPQLGEL